MGLCSEPEIEGFPDLERNLATVKHGKYTATLVWGFRSATLKALKIAETRAGRPVHIAEIYRVFQETSMFPKGLPAVFLKTALYDLWRNDELMCDKGGDRMSVNPAMQKSIHNESAEYELYSDRYQRLLSSRFVLSQTLQLLPAPEKPVVNLK